MSKPNLVFFISDDHSRSDSSVYGATDVLTPNMERLSKAGMTFDRAFVASPTCAPSRTCYLTGLTSVHNGVEPNQVKPREGLKTLPAYLKEQGYEVVAIGKVGHYDHTRLFGFDLVEHTGYHDDEAVPAALNYLKNRTSTKPLAFFVGTNWPHVPWPKTGEGYDAAKAKLPATFIDTPQTRRWRARYYAAIKRCDTELGQVYDLAREKLGPNTFFAYSADHGAQWPFSKWNLYDGGIRVPLIVSWPGVIKPGTRTNAMVSCIDFLPTLVEVAGGNAPATIDGKSYLPVLRGQTKTHRDIVFSTHSGDGEMNVYPMRSARSDKWKYIWNLHPEFSFTTHIDRNADAEPDPYWPTWETQAKTDAHAAAVVERYHARPEEELYDILADPNELRNLANVPEYADTKRKLRAELEAWMNAQGDQRKVFNKPRLLSDPKTTVATPRIAGKALTITCDVTPRSPNGVILAQGGNQYGYALHLKDGKPIFSVRESRTLYTAVGPAAPTGKFSIEAHLQKDGAMTLAVNGHIVAKGKAPGVIANQPAEELSIGEDTRVAVGDYAAPNPLQGTVKNVVITAQ